MNDDDKAKVPPPYDTQAKPPHADPDLARLIELVERLGGHGKLPL